MSSKKRLGLIVLISFGSLLVLVVAVLFWSWFITRDGMRKYHNKEYGVTMRYPKEMVLVREGNSGAIITPGNMENWRYLVQFSSTDKSLADVTKEEEALLASYNFDYRVEDTKLGDLEAKQIITTDISNDYGNVQVLAKDNNTLVKVITDSANADNSRVFNSFKFLKK